MKQRAIALAVAVCLLLSGCSWLLERSYSSVEPYTDRYWASDEEDILKAESYQDLVNLLLMLVDRRSEEGVIRYTASDWENGQIQAARAKYEVCSETVLGAYYLDSLVVTVSKEESYCTMTCYMKYREGVQDISSMMALSDSESLVDLLRLAVREGHESLTAQFISKVSCSEVEEAVDQLWRELYLIELEESGALTVPENPEDMETDENDAGEGTEGDTDTGEQPDTDEEASSSESGNENAGEDGATDEASENGEGENGESTPEPPAEPEIIFPPCPWTIIFYPNTQNAEIVEIRLK